MPVRALTSAIGSVARYFAMLEMEEILRRLGWGNNFVAGLKEFGSRGVRPDQREYFEKVVDELVQRGLLTRQDIVEADKPKTPNSGITVIEHAPDSEAGQELLRLDQTEREFYERQRRAKTE